MGLYLYGCGGIGVVALEVASAAGLVIDGFLDDFYSGTDFRNVPVSRTLDNLNELHPGVRSLIVCLGDNRLRKKTHLSVGTGELSLIHPSALVSESAAVGAGSLIFHGGIIQASATIGMSCILNTAVRVDHDCIIDDFSHIAPNTTLCGNVQIGEGANIGAGSVILPNLKVGRWSVVGAGAVVIKDVPDYSTVVGNPARVIKSYEFTSSEPGQGVSQ